MTRQEITAMMQAAGFGGEGKSKHYAHARLLMMATLEYAAKRSSAPHELLAIVLEIQNAK